MATLNAVAGCAARTPDCSISPFDAGGCIDNALAGAQLSSLQITMLDNLCAACNEPQSMCAQHSSLNGPHNFGDAIVFASDSILMTYGQTCIDSGKGESNPLNCENDSFNCLMDHIFAPYGMCN